MTNNDEENFNEEINLQNYKHDNIVDLRGLIRQFDENKLLFLGHL